MSFANKNNFTSIKLHIENPKDFTKKTVRTNKLSKVAECKINIQKSVVCQYTITINYEKENNSTYNCITNNKILGINLTKAMKDLYTELQNIGERN